MKKIYVAILALGLVSSALIAGAAGTNLVQNGDFETVSSTPTIPQGWSTDSWGTISAAFTYPVTGNGGGKAAQVQVTSRSSGDAKWMFDHVPVTPGQTYTYSDNYKSTVATEVDAEYKMSNGSFTYVWLGDIPASATNWGTFTAPVTVPAGVVSVSMLHVIAAVGTLAIDNVSLTLGTSTPPPPPPPPGPTPSISSFVANPTSFLQGSSTQLGWSVSNASTTSINQGIGTVTGTSLTVSPTQTTTYVLTATNPIGSANATTTVTVTVPPSPPAPKPTINSFIATPSNIASGSSTVLSWSVDNASTTSLNQGIGTVTGTQRTVSPTATTTYVLTATNGSGSVTATTTVTVTPPPPPPPPPPTPIPTINSFIATPQTIASGSSTVLSWSVTGASSTSLNQGIGTVTGTSRTVSPTATTTYVLTATNPGGSVTATTTVNVTPPPPPPPPSGNNLINNGNLEAGTTNNPTGWNQDFWGTLNASFSYPVTGNGGGKAAKVTVTNWSSGDAKWDFDHVAVSSHTIYQYSDDYMTNVYDNVTVEFLMSNGTYQYQWVGEPEPTGSAWKHFTAEITVPVGAVSMTIMHVLDKNGTLTIDNASLIALSANPFSQGMVTFTFDDNLVSQYNNARPILNTAGIKVAYGIITQAVRDITGNTSAMTWAQITTLKNEGNEISSHTRTHPDLTTLTASQQASEIQGAMSDLIAQGFAPKTFIYPLGAENSSIEAQVKNAGYIGARGSYWGLNSPTANRWAAYDVRLDRATTAAAMNAMIAQAVADKRWLIIELHDVLPSGGDEYAITNTKLQNVVNYIKANNVKTVTLQEGMALMQSQ